ncbi:MAG: metallophosphoesterase [Pirellulaceae bacterium]|nr:metallophosphoesterase [Pirellulaceae bacterium]
MSKTNEPDSILTMKNNARNITRRRFAQGTTITGVALANVAPALAADAPPKQFRLWAIGDPHVGTDIARKRESLADAIRQSEQGTKDSPPFDWDIAINVGDFSGTQGPPDDDEGHEVVRQFGALKKHRREDFYDIAGNHDASGQGEPTMGWFRKWVDPLGENTTHSGVDPKRRRYPVIGTWERYEFRIGNLLFLMMSDRNDLPVPVGRGKRGGYPAGAVTSETVAWWMERVEANRDSVIISAHHHMLRETTVGSGDFEGGNFNAKGEYISRYHGNQEDGGSPEGSSYLYYVDDKPKAMAFEKYLEAHPGAIDLWFGGHTHTNPDDHFNGRTHIEHKWGATFINCCCLTRFHVAGNSRPLSRLLTFTEGSAEVRVQCYLHTNTHASQGWYPKAERVIELGKPFHMS